MHPLLFAGISPHFTVLTKRPQQEPPIALWPVIFTRIRPQRYIFEQGHNLSSVSRIIVELKTDTDILDVRVGGDGIIEGVLNKNTSIWGSREK